MEITIKVKNEKKTRAILNLLEELSLLEIKEDKKSKSKKAFENLFGIWKNRSISAESLRKEAWKEKV